MRRSRPRSMARVPSSTTSTTSSGRRVHKSLGPNHSRSLAGGSPSTPPPGPGLDRSDNDEVDIPVTDEALADVDVLEWDMAWLGEARDRPGAHVDDLSQQHRLECLLSRPPAWRHPGTARHARGGRQAEATARAGRGGAGGGRRIVNDASRGGELTSPLHVAGSWGSRGRRSDGTEAIPNSPPSRVPKPLPRRQGTAKA